MLSRDFVATLLPGIIGNIVFLPNDLRLLLARKWEHPENIIQGVVLSICLRKYLFTSNIMGKDLNC